MPSISARIAIRESGFLSKKVLIYFLKLAITIAILAWLINYFQFQKIYSVLRQANASAIILAALFLPINLGLQWWKWHLLLQRADAQCRPHASLFSLLAGFPLGLLTPGRWGELGRALFLKPFDKPTIIFFAALDKIYNLLAVALAGTLALFYFLKTGLLPQVWESLSLFMLAFVFILNVLALLPAVIRYLFKLPLKIWQRATHSLKSAPLLSYESLFWVWILSFLFVITYCAQLVILIRGFTSISMIDGLAASASTFLTKSLLPIVIGDLGIREGAAAFFFAWLGVAPEIAFNASLLLFVINLLLPSLIGLGLIWKFKPNGQE